MKAIHPLIRDNTATYVNDEIKRIAMAHCSKAVQASIYEPFTDEYIREFLAARPDSSGCKKDASELAAFRLFVMGKITQMVFFANTKVRDWELKEFTQYLHPTRLYSNSEMENEITRVVWELNHIDGPVCTVCRDHVHLDFGDLDMNDFHDKDNFPKSITTPIDDDTEKVIVKHVEEHHARLNFAAAQQSRDALLMLDLDPKDYGDV